MPHPVADLPTPAPEALADSARLSAFLVDEISNAGGWISFARFMERALYAPALGYYTGAAAKLGAPGDFVTAPEMSSLFSATLARQVAEILGSSRGDVLELGAGSGRMAVEMLSALAGLDCVPERYWIIEVSPGLQARQRERIAKLPPTLRAHVAWLEQLPDSIRGVIVANEVLDALPVHLVAWSESGLYERGVEVWQGRFTFAERPLAAGRLQDAARRLQVQAPYVSEIGLAASALVRTLAERLEHGVLLLIDYGFGAAEYYHPQRDRGTLMCHYRHRAHDDPFFLPGLQDITAHVDFSAVARSAQEAGLQLCGYANQAQFLVNLGITELLSRTPADDAAAFAPLAAQANKLLSPAEMGELFKVIALGRGLDSALTGFARGDLGRLL